MQRMRPPARLVAPAESLSFLRQAALCDCEFGRCEPDSEARNAGDAREIIMALSGSAAVAWKRPAGLVRRGRNPAIARGKIWRRHRSLDQGRIDKPDAKFQSARDECCRVHGKTSRSNQAGR